MSILNYKTLDIGFNACVQTMAKIAWGQSYDTSETEAPDTFEKLKAEFSARKRITVYSGHCDKTIFGEPDINIAWHDYCHLAGDFDFTLEGETAAASMQCDMVRKRYNGKDAEKYCQLIMAEVVGQALYEKRHGKFPDNQYAFIEAYLENPEKALATNV